MVNAYGIYTWQKAILYHNGIYTPFTVVITTNYYNFINAKWADTKVRKMNSSFLVSQSTGKYTASGD